MLFNLTSIAYEASKAIQLNGISISKSHLLEIASAMCGFGTYSAYLSEEDGNLEGLFYASYVVLSESYAIQRCRGLLLSDADSKVVIGIIGSIMVQGKTSHTRDAPKIFLNELQFSEFLSEFMQLEVSNSDSLISAYAETNATPDYVYVDDLEMGEDIRLCRNIWEASATGGVDGDQDPERLYYGHKAHFTITSQFEKIGRVGLCYLDSDIEISIDDGEDQDFESLYAAA